MPGSSRLTLPLALVLAAAGPAAGAALAEPGAAVGLPEFLPGLEAAKPFSADVELTQNGGAPVRYHLDYVPPRIRLDGPDTLILRLDQRKAYIAQGGNSWLSLDLGTVGGTLTGPAHPTSHVVGTARKFGHTCQILEVTAGSLVSTTYVDGGFPVFASVHGPGGTSEVRVLALHPGAADPRRFDLSHASVTSMAGYLKEVRDGLQPPSPGE